MTNRTRQRLEALEQTQGTAEAPEIIRRVIDAKGKFVENLYLAKDGQWRGFADYLQAEGKSAETVEFVRKMKALFDDDSETPDNLTPQQCIDTVAALLVGDLPAPRNSGGDAEPNT